MPTITEDDLIDMAGWPVFKHARTILASGAVESAQLSGNHLKGVVASGKKQHSCGLLIHSKTDTENLCTCLESKRDGKICAHTVAVALATIGGMPTQRAEKQPVEQKLPTDTAWQIYIPRAFPEIWEKGTLPVRLIPTRGAGSRILSETLQAFGVRADTKSPAMLRLDREQANRFLLSASGHPEAFLEAPSESPIPLRISDIPCRLALDIAYEETSGELLLNLDRGKTRLLIGDSSIWVFQNAGAATILPLPLPGGAAAIAELSDLLAGEVLRRPLEWLTAALPILSEAFQLTSSDGFLNKLDLTAPLPVIRLDIEGSLRLISAQLSFSYPEPPVAGDNLEAKLAKITANLRNPAAEKRARELLQEAGFDGALELRGEDEILNFYASYLPRLEAEWKVDTGERFAHVSRNIERLQPQLEPRGSGEDWFGFAVNYRTPNGKTLSAAEIRRLLDAGESSTKAGGKRIAIDRAALDDLQAVLRDTDPQQAAGGDYRVSPAQAEYIRSTLGEPSAELAQAPAVAIAATLRPYQSQGLAWLYQRLAGTDCGAILADEMGLGKTLQTLALISALDADCAALVVCPTSLIHSWAGEAEKFAPGLNTLALHGNASRRKQSLADISDHQLILTSYGALVRDLGLHLAKRYSIVVLDEASFIKNPDTKNAKAARALAAQAPARLALTGTPIENSVRDLWSIMEFTLPGYLGSREDFRQRYELPIASNSKPEQSRLRRRLAPFLLRRTKREVAKDLPDKIQQIVYCELSAAQRTAYETFLAKGREQIQELLGTQGFGKARMSILTTLLRLRQTCCHLRLIDAQSDAASGKLDALRELLREAVEGGHRVLVFSQFVTMLGLIRSSLEADGLAYAYLDGATPGEQRAEQVKQFQATGGPPIFLISLKAGGYGLTLTAADTVIHYDPWWNPAVENQATDRAHRIGQRNPVTAYKLITSGTIEERILSLQGKKQGVIEAALDDDAPMMSGLTEDDICEILG